MGIEPGDIVRDTEPRAVPGVEGRYQAVIPDAWRIFYAFGGATMATAMRAATAAVGREDLRLISADATFCAAVPCGPVAVQVEVLRQGRNGAQAIARLWALDPEDPDPAGTAGADLVLTCVFGAPLESSFRFVGAEFPDVPGPHECPTRAEMEDRSPFAGIPYHQQTEFRLTDPAGLGPDAPPREPRMASWFRFVVPARREDGSWEPTALALPGDILGSAVHAGAGGSVGPFMVISLQISLQIVGEPATEWLLQHTRAHIAHDGYSTGTAELWDEERNLVAIATQIARIQPIRPS